MKKNTEKDTLLHGSFCYDTPDRDAVEDVFYYDDAFFMRAGSQDNAHLTTLSLAAALCLSDKTDYAEAFLAAIGFDMNSLCRDETDVVKPDTIGSLIACKPLDGAILVAVVLRGQRYGTEWCSNVDAGVTGDAKGIADSAEKVTRRLSAFIKKQNIRHAKIWITGYSRAGSVANMMGRTLNEAPEAFAVTKDDIYVYTFDALRCSADDTLYHNIHNIYHPDDMVTYLYPARWGLGLNGVEEPVGGGEQITAKIMTLGDGSYSADYAPVAKATFMERFSAFTAVCMSREQYAATMQEPLKEFVKLFFGKSYYDQGVIMRSLPAVWDSMQCDDGFLPDMMSLLAEPCKDTVQDQVAGLLFRHLDKVRKEEKVPLSEADTQIVKRALRALLAFLGPAVEADLCCVPEEGAEEVSFYHIMTFALCFGELLKAHSPELLFAAVKSKDSYYASNTAD